MKWVHAYTAIDLANVGIACYHPSLVTLEHTSVPVRRLALGRIPEPTHRLIKEASGMDQEYKWVVTWQ